MTALFTEEWFAAVRPELADVAGPPTLSATVQVEVTGGSDGDAICRVEFTDGRLVDAGPGPADGADVTLTVSEADARDILAGRLDPSVAFMQGRMKVNGSMGPVIDLLSLSATEGARDRRARVAGLSGLD
ncbi:MAG: SCP2 sterol-binding domain-containing protein [Acidimicrobiales bacterium]